MLRISRLFLIVIALFLNAAFAAAETQSLGAFFCLSGPCAVEGTDFLQGVRIAVAEASLGEADERPIVNLEIIDSNTTPIAQALQEFKDRGVKIVIGKFGSIKEGGQNVPLLVSPRKDGAESMGLVLPSFRFSQSPEEFDQQFRKYYEQESEGYAFDSFKSTSAILTAYQQVGVWDRSKIEEALKAHLNQ